VQKRCLPKPKFHSALSQREPLTESTIKKAPFQLQQNLLLHQIFRAEFQQINQSKMHFNWSDLKPPTLNKNQIQNTIEATQEPWKRSISSCSRIHFDQANLPKTPNEFSMKS